MKSLAISEEIGYAIESINEGIESGVLSDASIFFDEVGPNHLPVKCGCFNSADIWNFTGHLVVTSVEEAMSVINIVNKFKLLYYYNWNKENDIIRIVGIANNPLVKTICRTKEDASELYRITGNKPVAVVDNFKLSGILKAIQT